MSKKVKQKRKQPKLIHGWPAKNVKCFKTFNNAIFYMKDPETSKLGFCIGVNNKQWSSDGLENSYTLWTNSDPSGFSNNFITLGGKADTIPTEEEISRITHWRDYKEYLDRKKHFKEDPWSYKGIKDEEDLEY